MRLSVSSNGGALPVRRYAEICTIKDITCMFANYRGAVRILL